MREDGRKKSEIRDQKKRNSESDMSGDQITEQDTAIIDSVWMNMMRGIAIIAVVIHHWILFIPQQSSKTFFFLSANFVKDVAGTTVHLFFILSGCGLTLSYLKKGSFSLRQWIKRRFERIIVPFCIVITLTFILEILSNFLFAEIIQKTHSWHSLLAYLTFTRNFYSPSWSLNPTLWFMPVIVGLYVLFPFLIKILQKYGSMVLFVISLIVTYGSVTLCELIGYPVSHQSAWPLFYVVEFSLGMLIGYIMYFHSDWFSKLVSLKMFGFGVGIYFFSWTIQKFWKLGGDYNDLFTAVGIYLMSLYAIQLLIRLSPKQSIKILNECSKESYMMYLIHGPLILYVARSLLIDIKILPLNSLLTIFISGLYCIFIFILARLISPLINSISSRLCNNLPIPAIPSVET